MQEDESLVKQESKQLATEVVKSSSAEELSALEVWAEELLAIRNSNLSVFRKTKRAVEATLQRKVIFPIVKNFSTELKRVGWDERSWAARLLGAGVLAAIAVGGQGAGIAALGGAIGVPLWIVFGAGGAFAGTLLDEIQKTQAG